MKAFFGFMMPVAVVLSLTMGHSTAHAADSRCGEIIGESVKPLKKATLKFDHFRVVAEQARSESPHYGRVIVTVGDGYQNDLVSNYGWSEKGAGQMAESIYASLGIKEASVNWEDRELFLIDIPIDAGRDRVMLVRDAFASMITHPLAQEVLTERSLGLLNAIRIYEADVLELQQSGRRKTSLLSKYSDGYDIMKRDGTNGFIFIKMHEIRKRSSFSYSDREFLSHNSGLFKIAMKPDYVILEISISGTSFRKIYGDIGDQATRGDLIIESKLEKLIREMDADGTNIIHLKRGAIGSNEELTVLTTKQMARKIAEMLSRIALP